MSPFPMPSWFARFNESAPTTGRFGPLEWRVLETLWHQSRASSVRDLQPEFPDIAYTTLMTTLDRLYRKGVLLRSKQGRAFFYQPRLTRPEFESARVASALRVALEGNDAALVPLMSYFVDAVSDRDHDLLDELEALVRARRAEIEGKRS
jgi:predicted transcriptional regulator